MAINPESLYPGKIAPSTPQYPYGAARNITLPGDGTGTPWEAALVNDIFGFQQAILTEGAVVPSGTPENALSSQYLTALKNVYANQLGGLTQYEAANTTDMIAGTVLSGRSITHAVGQRWSSGMGFWEVISTPVADISDFKPLGDIWIDDFGADRFTTVDSLAAINAALAVKGVVRAMPGTYYISDEVLIDSDTHFVGAGKFATVIRPNQDFIDLAAGSGGRNIVKNKDAADPGVPLYNANRDIVISDMQFRYTDTDPGINDKINCIGFNNAKRLTVRDCYEANMSQHFVDISGCDEVLVENNTCVNGYWSRLQVDNGGGIYNVPGFPGTTKSANVTFRGNRLEGSKINVGAIQIHKKGGDNVTIESNTIIGGETGIVADDYFANTFTIEASSVIRILNNYVSVNQEALNIGKTVFNMQIIGNTLGSATDYALRVQAGDGINQYSDNATIANNKCFGDIYIVGLRKSAIYGNNWEDQTTEAILSTKETTLSDNNFEIKGILHKDVSLTDPRDSTVYDYALSNNKVARNICNNGSGVGFAVESAAFHVMEYLDNTGFLTANTYDFSLAVVKQGILINDYFRKSLRESTPTDLPEPLVGQQAFYALSKRPVWYNGTNWIYADGTVAL